MNPQTQFETDYSDVINDFLNFSAEFLGIALPVITFVEGTSYPESSKTFGLYNPNDQSIHVAVEGRHIMDVFRTLAHELVHHRQITQNVDWPVDVMESDANTVAALIMRAYANDCPAMFGLVKEDAVVNSAGSGGVAGIGVGPQGEPGFKRKKFAGADVFEVDGDIFHRTRFGKKHYGRYRDVMGDTGVGHEVRHYGNKHYGRAIVLQHKDTGAMHFLRYGKG